MAQMHMKTSRSGPMGSIGAVLGTTSKLLALAGGTVLVALTLMTIVSILGRGLFSSPVPGDFELVEIGCAIAVFSFLPYCQFIGGNVRVDFFTTRLPETAKTILDCLGSLTLAVIASLFAWRMTLGAMDMYDYQETTMILAVDRWWGFIPMVFASGLLVLVSLFTVWRRATSGANSDKGKDLT